MSKGNPMKQKPMRLINKKRVKVSTILSLVVTRKGLRRKLQIKASKL